MGSSIHPKRSGKPNGPTAPWKHKVKEQRRKEAEERQKIYDAKSLQEKLRYCGQKEREKLLAKESK